MRICWYMRGSISLEEAFALEPSDKKIISDIIKENMEATKKSGMPIIQ